MTAVNPPAYIQASSHPADSFRRAIQAALRGGYGVETFAVAGGDLAVSANGTPNMSVNVAAGRCVIPNSQNALLGGVYEAINDATVNLTISAAHATLPRNDLIVASVQDAAYSGASNQWLLQVVAGTPASSPADPSVPANSVSLARVRVDAAVSSIVAGKITDLRAALANTAQLLGQVVGAGGNGGGLGLFTVQGRFLGLLAAPGPPSSGTYATGDNGFDSVGVQWYCTVGGSPGTWVPLNGGQRYHAEVHASGGQVINNATITIVTFDVVDSDPNTNFSTGTNRYTCPIAGRYRVTSSVTWLTPGAKVNPLGISVYKNAAQARVGTQLAPANGDVTPVVTVNAIIACAAADLLDVRVTQSAGGAYNTSGGSAFTYAIFEYVGP